MPENRPDVHASDQFAGGINIQRNRRPARVRLSVWEAISYAARPSVRVQCGESSHGVAHIRVQHTHYIMYDLLSPQNCYQKTMRQNALIATLA